MKSSYIRVLFTIFSISTLLLFAQINITNADIIVSEGGGGNASDPFFQYQSYLNQTYIQNVWYKHSGKEVIVAVLDSGVDLNHSDLVNSFWRNNKEVLSNGVDDDGNGYIDDYYGYNFVASNVNMSPYNSHGTMVAGIIAAQRNNNIGIAGIASGSKIMPLIVCSVNGCPNESIIKAIRYAVDNGAHIINLSLGGNGSLGYNPEYDEIIKYAYDRNVLIIAAVGNGDTDGASTRGQDISAIKASPVSNEGELNMILGVGALDSTNQPTRWTNYSMKYVDISAPGEDILSTSVPLHTQNNYAYDVMDGTSFSAPIVAGVAAILKEQHPTWKNYDLMNQIISRSDVFSQGWNVYGRILNARNIISLDYPDPEIYSVSPSIIDGAQTVITITGKNFKSDLTIQFSNSSFSGYVPAVAVQVSPNLIKIDLGKWNGIKTTSEKYSIFVGSLDRQTSRLLNALEIRNIIKTQITQPNINQPIAKSPIPAPVTKKYYATFKASYNVREKAISNAKVISTTKRNVSYEVIDLSKKDWVKIKINKKDGWVLKKFAKISIK